MFPPPAASDAPELARPPELWLGAEPLPDRRVSRLPASAIHAAARLIERVLLERTRIPLIPEALLARLEASGPLPDEDRRTLALIAARRRTAAPREELCSEREPVDGPIVILDGLAARFRTLQSGKRQIVGFLLPGDMVDLSSGEQVSTYGLCALAPTIFARILSSDFAEFMLQSPRVAQAVWKAQNEHMSQACEWLLNVGQRNAEQRIAHLFCEQYHRMRGIGRTQGNAFAFPVTQRDLADSAGLTNVHVNRVLKKLREERLLAFEAGAATILDLERLAQRAEFDPHYLQMSS